MKVVRCLGLLASGLLCSTQAVSQVDSLLQSAFGSGAFGTRSDTIYVYRSGLDQVGSSEGVMYTYLGYANLGVHNYYLRVKRGDGPTESLKFEEARAFKFGDGLFRVDPDGMMLRLMESGPVCYWENGFTHSERLRTGDPNFRDVGHRHSFISIGINGDAIPLAHQEPTDQTLSTKPKRYKEFIAANPRLNSLFECLDKSKLAEDARECVKRSNQ